jgi:1,4-dihydroxy-2-naphthoate polyprenyltransferase
MALDKSHKKLNPPIQAWLHAFRLRTLPLAFSSIITGSFLAWAQESFSGVVLALALSTTLFLQILSNLANDYGDSEKGTDNHERIGPVRAVQSGAISLNQMKRGMWLFALLSLISGLALLYFGTKNMGAAGFTGFLMLGLLAIAAAIMYTVGKKAYGYLGLGDIFVFVFFGLTGVCGTFYLHTHIWNPAVLLPATSIGLLSVAVLNLNNMRDREADARAGKRTLAVRLGNSGSRKYHVAVLAIALTAAIVFSWLNGGSYWQFIYFITAAPILSNIRLVLAHENPSELDPELKKIALTTFLFSITFGLGLLF